MCALIAASEGQLPTAPRLWSMECRWQDLCTRVDASMARTALDLSGGWARRWTARWKFGRTPVVCAVKDLPTVPAGGSVPVRRFSWRTGQKNRPGLEFLVSTGRHHGFESLAERDLLLALDFAAAPSEVLSQPFTLRFATAGGEALEHIPDFLAFTPAGRWLIDVRPGHLIKDVDLLRFAAAGEVALSCGWGYIVVTGWHRQVMNTLDVLSSQRRALTDAFGLQAQLSETLSAGPAGFDELARATRLPAVARAQLLHMLWHRRAGVDLAEPFDGVIEPAVRRRRQPTMAEAGVQLALGTFLVIDGLEWRIDVLEAHVGKVVLARPGGEPLEMSIGALMNHPDCAVSTRSQLALPAADRGRQPKGVEDLTDWQFTVAELRLAHLLEAETGYRSGDPGLPGPGEPRPGFDPATTTLTERRRAKAAEMKQFAEREPELAKANGLAAMSYGTLVRWSKNLPEQGVLACADDRWLRPSAGHAVAEEVREALVAVHRECLRRSAVSMRTRERLIHQFVRERYGEAVAIPSLETLRLIWAEWFGAGRAKQRYVRSAATVAAVASMGHVIVRRPGQVVALDTTPVPVKLRDGVFGEPVTAYLTLALDVYTRSMVAFRLTSADTTSVDVAMLLRDVMTPVPMRPGWGPELAWPYPGVPGQVVAELAGHPVVGLPFFAPETVTTDHGGPYKSRHATAVQRSLGVNILPSRVLRPTDKQAVERAFDAAKTMLFQLLPGYTGSDVSERGADPEGDAALTLDRFENMVATWVVTVWQSHRLGEYAPEWDPAGRHSPNTLFAAAMAQGGFALQIPSPELFYQHLPQHPVAIHPKRGVKISGLWYHDGFLEQERFHRPSPRGGAQKARRGAWIVHHDPRDRRYVFFQDDLTHRWIPLRWTGMTADDEVPVFGSSRVEELLQQAARAGLKPKTDRELMPLLLKILGSEIPVDNWATQMTRKQRAAHARESAAGLAALYDRPAAVAASVAAFESGDAQVIPLRARQVGAAVSAERARRRQAAVPVRPEAPPRLGASVRGGELSVLFGQDDGAETDSEGQHG